MKNFNFLDNNYILKFIIILLIILIKFYIISINSSNKKFDIYFNYHYFQREIITQKMKVFSSWQLKNNEPYFINGIIRKYKPKKCLEVGVALGGSSIVILNALKDIKDSF